MVLATDDFAVLYSNEIDTPGTAQIKWTISDSVGKWYSFGSMQCPASNCIWILMT